MSDERFTVSSPKAIEGLIEAWSSFTPASRALDGVTPWFTGQNAHHPGLLVLMRRILGAWPPPGGGPS